jgi:methylglyoxal/glyoxal reductase
VVTYTSRAGIQIPALGLGCWDLHGDEAYRVVRTALDLGYRLIDTAAMYGNESEIGKAIQDAKVPREEIYLTTKLANADQGLASARQAYEKSLARLGLDYVDLYLIHWPIKGKRQDSWKAFEALYQEKKVKAIGVCNYLIPFLEELDTYAREYPVLNQCEFYPYLYQPDLLQACQQRGILLQSWAPLVRGHRIEDPRLQKMAFKYNKSAAQILLRWAIEHGIAAIPKSASTERLKENIQIFDFSLTAEDLAEMDSWNENFRVSGEDPLRML